MLMVDDNVGNQLRQNVVLNVGNQVVQNAVQNPGIQIVKNMNGLSVSIIANQYGNINVVTAPAEGNVMLQLQIDQEEEARIQSTQEEFKFMVTANASEETYRVKANCILENNLQQASTSGTQSDKPPVYDSDGSAENDSNVISEVSNIEQGGGTVEQHPVNVKETRALYDSLYNNLLIEVEKVNKINHKLRETNADLTTELARYRNQEKCFEISQEKYDKLERVQNFKIQFLKEAAKFVLDFKSLAKEADESLAKHKALELEIERLLKAVIERLQAQLGGLKGKSKDTPCVSNTLDPLPQKLKNENVELEFQLRAQLFDKVSEQKDTTCGMSANTKFAKQSILGKPPSSSRPKLYAVTPLPKSKDIPKIDELHALSKPVTSNSAHSTRESKGVQIVNVISPKIFKTNPSKTSRNDVNSKTNGSSPKDVKRTIRTRRPQPRNNPKNDKIPYKSKSCWLSNSLEKIEENHRNLQSSSN
nr:hypothetical protein [Tanacetum cinerariifolium]